MVTPALMSSPLLSFLDLSSCHGLTEEVIFALATSDCVSRLKSEAVFLVGASVQPNFPFLFLVHPSSSSQAVGLRLGGPRVHDDALQRHLGLGGCGLDGVLGLRRSGRHHGLDSPQSRPQASFPRQHLRLERRKRGSVGPERQAARVFGRGVGRVGPL